MRTTAPEDRLLVRVAHYTARARSQLRNGRMEQAALFTRRAEQLLDLVAQARLVRAVTLLETSSTHS